MGRYRKVELRMWGDEKFARLTPMQPCGQSLWVWLLTGPLTTNLPGIIVGTPAALAGAIGWSQERFLEPFGELFREGMLKADERAGLVWLPNALKHNEPENPNVVKGWHVAWDLIPECPLQSEIWTCFASYMEKRGPCFLAAFRNGCRNHQGTVPRGLPKSGTGTGTGTLTGAGSGAMGVCPPAPPIPTETCDPAADEDANFPALFAEFKAARGRGNQRQFGEMVRACLARKISLRNVSRFICAPENAGLDVYDIGRGLIPPVQQAGRQDSAASAGFKLFEEAQRTREAEGKA